MTHYAWISSVTRQKAQAIYSGYMIDRDLRSEESPEVEFLLYLAGFVSLQTRSIILCSKMH